MNLTTETLRTFLNTHPAISLSAIERKAKIPHRTLTRVKHSRNLPAKHVKRLLPVLKEYGFAGDATTL